MRLLWKNYIYEAVSINKEYLLKLANGDFARFQEAKAKAAKIVKDTNMNPPEKDSIKIQALLTKFILQNQLPNSVGSFIHDIINENKLNILFKLNSDSTKEDFQNLIDEYNSSRMSNSGEKLSSDELCVWLRTKIHHDFGDGYKWVIALDGAGKPIGYIPSTITQKTMKHCGNEPSHAPGDVYYGLRDANNKEIVTVIVDSDSKIKESKGYNNQPPRNKEIINKYMQWLIMHPDIKGVSYDNGYARHMNYGVSQMSQDEEFISKVKKEKPEMIHPDVDGPILNWKEMIQKGEATEEDLLNEYRNGKIEEYDNPLMLEHLIGILGRNPFDEQTLVNMARNRDIDAVEIGNAGTQYLTVPVQHALLKHRSRENAKTLIEIYNQVPNNKIDIGYILNIEPEALGNVIIDKRLEAAKRYIPEYEGKSAYYKSNINQMFWDVFNHIRKYGQPPNPEVDGENIKKVAALDDFLIKSGKIDVNKRNGYGGLIAISIVKIPEILEVFLNNGLDPNAIDVKGATFLSHAIETGIGQDRKGNPRSVELLLKAGADPNYVIPGSRPYLFYASVGHGLEELLKDPRTNINIKDEFKGDTTLIYNVWNSDDESTLNISALLKHSPNLELYNNQGYTALMMAVRYGNYVAAEMLLEAGADVKTKTPIGDVFKIAEGNKRFTSLLDSYNYDEDYDEQ